MATEYEVESMTRQSMEFFLSGNMSHNQTKKTKFPLNEHSQLDSLRAISQFTLKHYMSNNRM